MTEMFKLVKPTLSQLNILEIEFYCYVMGYKFIYDEKKVLINNEDGKMVGFIQNGSRKVFNKHTGLEYKEPILNIIYGREKICLTDLFYSCKLLSEFVSSMEKKGISKEQYEEKGLYVFLYELSQIDFFKRYNERNKVCKEGSVVIEEKDYKTQKSILYDLITSVYPKAKLLFRKTDDGVLIVSKEISSSDLELVVSKLFNTKIVNDKGLYENLRYGKRYGKRDRKTA